MGMVVAAAIALHQVNLETLRGDVLGILRGATGLPVEIDGAVSWKFSLRPRIQLYQVRVPNADWAHHEYAFSAEKIDVTLDLFSIMRDRPTIKNVKIYDATVCVEKNDAGELSVQPINTESATAQNDDNSDADTDDAPDKYPFADPGLGGIEVKNLVAHIFDATYSMAGVNVRYMPRDDVREYAGWIKPTDKVYPFIVAYSEYNTERKVYPVRVAISTGGEALIANVMLDGVNRMPVDFSVTGDIPDVAALGAMFNLDIASMPAMYVNFAGGFDNKKITLRKSSLRVRGNQINISGSYDWSRRRPSISLDLTAARINLMELFPELYASKRAKPVNRELNVFKDIPLYGSDIRPYDIKLRVDIDKLFVYRDLVLADIGLRGDIKDGAGRVTLHGNIGGGDFSTASNVEIDASGRMDIVAAGTGENVSIGEILNQLRIDDLISDLPVNFIFYQRAAGHDLSELMQTLTGPVQVYSSGSGYAHSALVSNIYGTDFLTSLRHSIQDLFRSKKKHDQIKISCAAISAKIRNGRIETENGVAVETNAINMRLSGNLDLGAESMHLDLATVPVRGLKLSLTGSVVNSLEIKGSLAEPDITLSAANIVGKVASSTGIGLLLAPLTGGISIAAGAGLGFLAGDLLENWLADDAPCKTALRRGAPDVRGDPEWMRTPINDLVGSVMDAN